jgi:Uma2 family endonuclease
MVINLKVKEMPSAVGKYPRRITFKTFLKKYNDLVDGYKYEWNDGIVEKAASMTTKEIFIVDLLVRCFVKLSVFENGGCLTSEIDQWVTESKYRRPDLAYFTKQQIREGRSGKEPVSEFMIEIISENDHINTVNDKILEYFDAGVKVVWLIFPNQQMVHVYTSPIDVKICKNDTICSALPVIDDFNIKVEDIFREDD